MSQKSAPAAAHWTHSLIAWAVISAEKRLHALKQVGGGGSTTCPHSARYMIKRSRTALKLEDEIGPLDGGCRSQIAIMVTFLSQNHSFFFIGSIIIHRGLFSQTRQVTLRTQNRTHIYRKLDRFVIEAPNNKLGGC